MKLLYTVFLGKFCLFSSGGLLTHCCVWVFFFLADWHLVVGRSLWFVLGFFLPYVIFPKWKKPKKTEPTKNKKTQKTPRKWEYKRFCASCGGDRAYK